CGFQVHIRCGFTFRNLIAANGIDEEMAPHCVNGRIGYVTNCIGRHQHRYAIAFKLGEQILDPGKDFETLGKKLPRLIKGQRSILRIVLLAKFNSSCGSAYSQSVFKSRAHRELALFRSEEHTSELQSRFELVCRLLLEKKK